MDEIRKAILATVIYYDILDFPLTAQEIFNLLINPNRIASRGTLGVHSFCFNILKQKLYPLRPCAVNDNLELLVKNKVLEELNGFYFLPSRADLYEKRIEKNKIAEQKWKKARRYLWLGQTVPFIEAIFASGSLALGQTGPESDLDVLVVAKSGRIWLARILLSLLMSILGVRRKNKERVAPDKICLNHYITTSSLRIPFHSLYNAQTYAHLTPLFWRNRQVVDQFWKQNRGWMINFLLWWENPNTYQRRVIRPSPFLRMIRAILEKILERTGLAPWLEKLARKIQLSRINLNLPGRITANDQQLEFHPYSVEKVIIQRYNLAIASWDLFGSYQELDSGLK